MDPLSDVLALLKPRSFMSAGLDAGGEWAVQFDQQHKTIKCGAVVQGQCWLTVAGQAQMLHSGDCFLLPHGLPFQLTTDTALTAVPAREVFAAPANGGIVCHQGGGDCFLVSSRFALDGEHADILLAMLPTIVVIERSSQQAVALRWAVERMMEEMRDNLPGSALLIEHLSHLVLMQALRLHLSGQSDGVGWLFALADRQMRSAISAMHERPARRWTLQELAETVGMSRSAFAQKFKQRVGQSPLDYLTRWRMLLAGQRLRSSNDSIAVIALSLGYESDSAFSTAFKRVMGCSPRQYGQNKGDSV